MTNIFHNYKDIDELHRYTEKRIQGWPHITHQLSALRHREEDTGIAAYTISIHPCFYTEKRIQGWPPILYPSICTSTQRRGYRYGRLYHTSCLHWFDPSFWKARITLVPQAILSHEEKLLSHILHFSISQGSSGALSLPGPGLGTLKIHYLLPTNYDLDGKIISVFYYAG